jgi:hypothetical protein
MRTKTLLLSALLGSLGSISLMAQSTNVYSLNAVGYINVTIPTGFSIISCPLFATDPSGAQDNTISNLLNASTGQFKGVKFYPWDISTSSYGTSDTATATKWAGGGAETLMPGQAAFIDNPNAPFTNTFVGTVPSGALTNKFYTGYTLVSSILPTSGLLTNGLMNYNSAIKGDTAYTYNTGAQAYDPSYNTKPTGAWITAPNITNVASGFFYFTTNTTPEVWVENFSVGQ